ncbi:MAG: DUF1566 domain-containing protein, partial [Deltaproteobacteria bacterium]|nr:DUF1566 domain-containing protein [Deltaproteobacteria bacterium]
MIDLGLGSLPAGNPFINLLSGTGVDRFPNWSSTTYIFGTSQAWLIDFWYPNPADKNTTRLFWPVRGGGSGSSRHSIALPKTGQTQMYQAKDDGELQKGISWPNPRFNDNNNGTVTDNLTGLIWLKNASCFNTRSWTDSLAAANSLASKHCGLTDGSEAGDWRLPNFNEMRSLIDYGNAGVLPNGHPFTGIPSSYNYFWSSTTNATFASAHYVFYFCLGNGVVYSNPYDSNNYAWPVRGGQIGDSGAVIVSFTPTTGGPGTKATITGTNLSGATAVRFGGKAAKSFTVDSSTQITAKVDDGAIG